MSSLAVSNHSGLTILGNNARVLIYAVSISESANSTLVILRNAMEIRSVCGCLAFVRRQLIFCNCVRRQRLFCFKHSRDGRKRQRGG